MIPVLKGQSLYEIMEYWSLNDLFLYRLNLQYEALYDQKLMEREKAQQEIEQRRKK